MRSFFYVEGTGTYSYHCASNGEQVEPLYLPLLRFPFNVLFGLLSSHVTRRREVTRQAEAPGPEGAHLQGLPEGLPRPINCTRYRN
jgi:hypothetical protein